MTKRNAVLLSWDDANGAGYLSLPDHPGPGTPGCVKRSVDFAALAPDVKGPQLILDLDKDNRVIGIEILRD